MLGWPVRCSEALRLDQMTNHGLPKLESLLLPVGRTLKDVDIYGLDREGRTVFGQVTNHSWGSPAAQKKLKRLSAYADANTKLVFFCKTDEVRTEGGVTVVPLHLMFDVFKATDRGRAWLRS